MDSSKLADRLRAVLKTPRADVQPASTVSSSPSRSGDGNGMIERVLGGEWREGCFVVERRVGPDASHGEARVGDLAAHVAGGCYEASLVAPGASPRPPFMFFDLETTGLSGGAGTQAFLLGCGGFDRDGSFVSRQYLLVRFADEPRLLGAFAAELARAGTLVSFNGKSFDAPILETRYLYHRLPWAGSRLPHVDMLHPSRRFWRDDEDQMAGCSLAALEQQVLGAGRVGDVPGFEIPARYFQFVRTGDPRPLAAVLEHNRLDLLSLAGLTARLLALVASGPERARTGREALALGRVYEQAALDVRARAAYSRAANGSAPLVRIGALRALAIAWRRARRHEESAACWRQVLEVRGCPSPVAREATEALAIHHEHRVRDLPAARAFALRSLEEGKHPAWADAVRHRLERIERKMAGAAEAGALLGE